VKEGWLNDDYLILFEDRNEALQATRDYAIAERIPGYYVAGLRSWDYFILCDASSRYFTVPTVPATTDEVKPYALPSGSVVLDSDSRYCGKIKWYITPIIFGGSPSDPENLTWINLGQHTEAVR
jgi:hypothetical protein